MFRKDGGSYNMNDEQAKMLLGLKMEFDGPPYFSVAPEVPVALETKEEEKPADRGRVSDGTIDTAASLIKDAKKEEIPAPEVKDEVPAEGEKEEGAAQDDTHLENVIENLTSDAAAAVPEKEVPAQPTSKKDKATPVTVK